MKKIAFGSKPSTASPRQSADAWVNDRDPTEPMKRLTIDVPLDLHKRIKSGCAVQGLKMADVVRELLEQRFTGHSAGEGADSRNSANAQTQKIVAS